LHNLEFGSLEFIWDLFFVLGILMLFIQQVNILNTVNLFAERSNPLVTPD